MGESKQDEPKAGPKLEEEKKEEKTEEKSEDKKDDKSEEKKEEAPPPPSPPIVLFVDMHCVGCAKRVERCMMKFKGVEGVEIDMAKNQVTVKGILDPQALCSRIQKKTKRKAAVLSPQPKVEGDSIQPEVVTSQVSGVATIELNVNMHCEACAQQLKSKILKMRGVQSAETDLSSGKVTVTGTMDADRLVDYVYRRTRKLARVVPQPEPKPEENKTEEGSKEAEKAPEEAPKAEENKSDSADNKEESTEEKKEEGTAPEEAAEEAGDKEKKKEKTEEGGEQEPKKEAEEINNMNYNLEEMAKKMYCPPLYVIEQVPPPQLFSDENPNACCIS